MSASWPNMVVYAAALIAAATAPLRWLRVCQREHYMAGYTTRFAMRWWFGSADANKAAFAALIACALLSSFIAPAGLAAALILIWAPFGLSLRGRTSKLVWTGRMKRIAAITWFDLAVLAAIFWLLPFGATLLLFAAIALPLFIDAYAAVLAPLERQMSQRFVSEAAVKLSQVKPLVIAVTGSYGKTTAKEYIRHLLAKTHQVIASPASFNNQLGLARTVNEHLEPGTEVLVAEMGDYGPGEIAEMCSWMRPAVGVVTATGYEHFERFKSMDAIADSKREVFADTEIAVLGGDSEPLAQMAFDLISEGEQRVLRASGEGRDADVVAMPDGDEIRVSIDGTEIAVTERKNRHPLNIAIAVAVAHALEVPGQVIAGLLDGLESPDHRATIERASSGATIIDDTYNSNPVGAAAALELLRRTPGDGRRVVVTPGMVEMGTEQYRLNREFAEAAAEVASDMVIVGHTNRRALRDGAAGRVEFNDFKTRDEATAWIRENLSAGDIVLYENDLPDHFP